MEIVVNDLRTGYVDVVRLLLDRGKPSSPRGLPIRELTGVTIVVPTAHHACFLPTGVNRKVNAKLAAVEALAMVAGTWPHDLVLAAAPRYEQVLVSGTDQVAAAAVAYGPRITGQLYALIDLLEADPDSRQAVLEIWLPTDLTRTGDKPCTLSLQFLLRRDGLETHVTMRSQDAWFGLGIDAFVFTQLAHTIAHQLEVPLGRYVHHVGSLHLYERDVDAAYELRLPSSYESTPAYGVRAPRPHLTAAALLAGDYDGVHDWYVRQLKLVTSR